MLVLIGWIILRDGDVMREGGGKGGKGGGRNEERSGEVETALRESRSESWGGGVWGFGPADA